MTHEPAQNTEVPHGDPTPPDAAAAGLAATPDQAKRGALGGILDAILKGLAPARRRTRRMPSWRRRSTAGRSSGGGGSGPKLALHYHDGGSAWATARVACGRRGNRIAVITSSDASWWRHLRTDSPVQVRVRNRWVDGRASVVARDDATYARAVGIFIEDHSRAAARRLGVPMDESGRLDHGPRRPGDAVVVWIEVEGE